MFSCENISFVLRTHHCSFALQTHRCSVTVTRKHSRSLSYVEMHQQSTRFQEVRMNNRKEASFSLGSYRGYSLYIYVYIHFQYFPEEKLIVHVNGYSFRLGISYGNTSVMYYVHSPCLQRKPFIAKKKCRLCLQIKPQTCKGLKSFALKNDHNSPACLAEPI